ncbi:MAG: hypothetical protein V4736_13235 [Bdellovibrionota bacterium]
MIKQKRTLLYFFTLLISSLVFNSSAFAQTENEKALSYLSYMSSQIVGRPLNSSEINLLKGQGPAAFDQIITTWTSDAAFTIRVQKYVENLVRANGETAGTNYNLPGWLGKALAANRRPYKELLTSTTCYSQAGQAIPCDTNAPFTAGVLTTKAYLSIYKGAYNISRAGKIIREYLCTDYPLSDAEEPRLEITDMIPQFATTAGKITFGNGNNCYMCHSQFGLHAQLFVKFDLNGVYQPGATGVQAIGATDGFSANSTLTSHLIDPNRASNEQTRILGQSVSNLAEAARVVTESPRFLPCAAKNMMRYFLRLSDPNLASVKPEVFTQIVTAAKVKNPEPGFAELIHAILIDPSVYGSFKKSGAMP